jgi:cobalt/nickel transport system permease protein
MNRDTFYLLVYLATILLIPLLRSSAAIAMALVIAMLLSGRDVLRVARQAGLAILLFTGVVSVSYAIAAAVRGELLWRYLVLLNLRAFLLCYLTVLFARKANPLRALSFSPGATYVFVLVHSQLATMRRMLGDFRLALRSRTLGRLRLRDLYRHSAASGSTLIVKGMQQAGEITMAMRARGFFDD